MPRVARLLAVACALCVPVGCGGDESVADRGGGGGGGTGVEEYAREVQRALTEPDCVALNGINVRAQEATAKYSRLACLPRRQARRLFQDFEVTGSEAYGTAAVVDYTTRKTPKGATMLLVHAPNGDWVLNTMRIALGGPVAGTSDEADREGYDEAVEGYVRALREEDCRAFFKHAHTFNSTAKAACEGELPLHAGLQAALDADPDAEPAYLGGNDHFGFYGVDSEQPVPETDRSRPRYHTIVVVRSQAKPPTYLVLSTASGPAR